MLSLLALNGLRATGALRLLLLPYRCPGAESVILMGLGNWNRTPRRNARIGAGWPSASSSARRFAG
jgi:hypothetical protein